MQPRRHLASLTVIAALSALAACGQHDAQTTTTDTVRAVSPDSAAKLDSAQRAADTVKPSAFHELRVPFSLVSTAQAQSTTVASSTTTTRDTGHRRFHWPWALIFVALVLLAAYAWHRKRQHDSMNEYPPGTGGRGATGSGAPRSSL